MNIQPVLPFSVYTHPRDRRDPAEMVWKMTRPNSPDARRFWAMGFVLRRARVVRSLDYGYLAFQAHFQCVCGRTEVLSARVDEYGPDVDSYYDYNNLYSFLTQTGSMSKIHLLQDGYTPEQVEQMLKDGENEEAGAALAHAGVEALQQTAFGVLELPAYYNARGMHQDVFQRIRQKQTPYSVCSLPRYDEIPQFRWRP